jgi:superoxide dismutase, Fe-Mn family
MLFTRRDVFRAAGAGGLLLAARPLATFAADEKGTGFSLPKLPYAYDALEPHIDAKTMQIHHDLHHGAYVKNLNAALADSPDLLKKSLTELITGLKSLPEKVQTAVRNNGGGHYNHTMFWEIMGPKKGGSPTGDLAKSIDAAFGNFAGFQKELKTAALGQFGSGWAWLVSSGGKVKVTKTANQDNPLMDGSGVPLLGIDVWEHAYYLKYQNKRADYIDAWWNTVNWDAVAERYKGATKG